MHRPQARVCVQGVAKAADRGAVAVHCTARQEPAREGKGVRGVVRKDVAVREGGEELCKRVLMGCVVALFAGSESTCAAAGRPWGCRSRPDGVGR